MTTAAHAAPRVGGAERTSARPYTVDIDIGGTLTDGLFSDGTTVSPVKVDTTPHDFTVCFFECLKEGARQLGYADLKELLAHVAVIRWSATIATNIIAERKGPRIGLLVSEGTGTALYGEGTSPAVDRLIASQNIVELADGASDAELLAAIRALLEDGVRRIAVSMGGSFADDSAEQAVRRLVDDNFPDHYLGAVPMVLGSEIIRHPDDQTRTHMALVNAYVHTPLAVALFKAEDELLERHNYRRPLYIAHVNGGVARVSKTKAVDTAESSPYFGLNACAWWARLYGHDKVLALDVGGTTAKLGVIVGGRPLTIAEGDLFGVPLKTPWTLLHSEAVGGGSVARLVDGEVTLGPDSQGAYPGPACYDLGGKFPTLTDAFLAAGMLDPDRFLGGRRALRVDLAREALGEIEPQRVIDTAADMVADVARRTLALAPEGDFELYCFGGNGANFAAPLAERLGLDQAYVFKLGPVLSAFGSSVAEICHVYEEWGDDTDAIAARGEQRVRRDLEGEGLSDIRIEVEVTGHVTVRGFSPVPVYTPQPNEERRHEVTGDVLVWDDLKAGAAARGPVRLESDTNTCTVPAGWNVRIDGHDNAILERS
ncbi:hydantoinase/oxoprolinase family protein [Solirubrobacter soli]|uniref:hydantoinase/oxoprolinase family protein n=1 Tax=Solirubrobacter soli TaxID=363832 RepID=UPI00041B655E|nr:hydantoinase/oxoprolinase family protein [Solirubrobacter soli]